MLGVDAESNIHNILDVNSNMKSDFFMLTPKVGLGTWNKSHIKGLNWTQTHKSSIFLEELFQEDELLDQMHKLNTEYIADTPGGGGGSGFTKQYDSNMF